MRKYEWTRKGMEHTDAEGSYVHVRDAEAERAGLLAAVCKLQMVAEEYQRNMPAQPEWCREIIEVSRAAIEQATSN